MDTPHRLVDRTIDGALDGVKGVVNSVVGGLQSAGGQVVGALDMPLKETLGIKGPLHIVDDVLNGSANATKAFLNQGILGALQQFGEGVSKGLDEPLELMGASPKGLPFPF